MSGTRATENELNAVNRGVYIADNLDFLRSLNDQCIDLITIDPPFAKNETYIKNDGELKPPLSEAEKADERRLLQAWGIHDARSANALGIEHPEVVKAGFRDIWSWSDDVHEEWLNEIDNDYRSISKLIDTTRYVHSDSTAADLCYMAVRLVEIHRVLKADGTFYLHCDHTANGYLRTLLDAIFGHENFRNEIIWAYPASPSAARKDFPRKHDTIFRYTKSRDEWTFNPNDIAVGDAESRKNLTKYAST